MSGTTLIARARRALRNLRTATGANVTITFALATIPIVGFVGAAVDYSHANSVKTALQAATDATALMLSKNAATETSSQLQTQATTYLTALFTRPEATGLTVNATYTSSGGSQVVVTSSANVRSAFMNLVGVSSMKVAADSQVKWGSSRLRVALVLDNTGSMADDGKISALNYRYKQSADAAQERRREPRRRLCLDHSIREGCQRRLQQLQGDLDRLDRLERQQRIVQQLEL
jgi:Flp pilus assembly protein TadG